MLIALFGLAVFGLLTSTVFAGMVVAGARFHLREPENTNHSSSSIPIKLSLIKPLHGSEPDLAANLATFFEQDYPPHDFEILFCAREEKDAALHVAREVAAHHSEIQARFLWTDGLPPYINAKVASLEKMVAAAAYEILVISDSDVKVAPEYLRAIGSTFHDPRCGAVTCLYRGVAAEGGLWARIEAVGMSVEMTAGVLVANMLEGMQFALGPTMAVRRECIERMGGMSVLGNYCSDDFLIGNRVFEQGRKVVLSRHVIDHMVINTSFAESIAHQVRWMKSTRFSRPKGHFGTALTFSMPFGLLAAATGCLLGHSWMGVGLCLLGWAIVTRWIIAFAAGNLVVRDPNLASLYVLYPLRDLMGFAFWVASYCSSEVWWRGRKYRLEAGGRMRPVELDT